jgi:mono/diheme cytochrome c family protein
LSNPEFLAAANDDFIVASIVLGRENTEMLPAGPNIEGDQGLSEEQIRNLTAYIRGWQTKPPVTGVPARYLVASYEDDPLVEMSVENGGELFAAHCAACHGAEGRGTRDVGLIADCASCHADGAAASRRWTSEDLVLHFGPRLNNPQFLTAATDGFLQATVVRGRRGTAMRGFGFDEHGRKTLDADSVKDLVIYMRGWQRRNPPPPASNSPTHAP